MFQECVRSLSRVFDHPLCWLMVPHLLCCSRGCCMKVSHYCNDFYKYYIPEIKLRIVASRKFVLSVGISNRCKLILGYLSFRLICLLWFTFVFFSWSWSCNEVKEKREDGRIEEGEKYTLHLTPSSGIGASEDIFVWEAWLGRNLWEFYVDANFPSN